ncbi:ParE toxin of type II toxin-antitoxin system, parDE [Chryseobacterium piscicola]|jgi:plasmid stabilization system protein ParE|uniref:ParE toxin of type II toxin-antitoxin system, parDE n=1 Tax=Chryseobacterium piscicola TaxID=551459 RepID=A0A1N7MNZ2_9FLAO|nr:type II toxin-antitoxin system RelE/ParE family toxin [Chryseobacterium piscicola]PQA93428.1 hypothetical protein B0A70_09755 [Chryseobacterium piscicola]SIS87864.1 ParE toxin of type II toxin-antitoxin system, parDE [Chryseobacterium piscicola]
MRKAKIVISENADFDLSEIADWYNEINKKLIWLFLKDFKKTIKHISENPFSCEFRYGNFRIAYLKRFPFGIHYQFDENKNMLKIFSVFHTSRNPENWKERK